MLKKFRLSSKAKPQPHQDGAFQSLATDAKRKAPKTGFFSLPAELRNHIYELAASQTDLCLLDLKHRKGVAGRKHSTTPSPSIPGLLLSSRQVRMESLAILLRSAKINVKVSDFDFAQLCKAIRGLDDAGQEAILLNRDLKITLRMKKSRIPWEYQLDEGNVTDIRQGQAGAVRWYAVRAGVLFEQERDNDVKVELTKILEMLHRALEEEHMTTGPRTDPVLMTSSWRPGMS
ncbi:hypothetical protein PRZ48_002394 [Zasmidium cellare]|uniref:Uncharacterized protein n=1 Tax=Zasmidium cellare TaxID=395010 RepID=A0ABR0F4K6_ZASCE|nr:hypothetical protein PRZ48_002394 [Zasmidium cellare]